MKEHMVFTYVLCALALLAGVGLIMIKQELIGIPITTASLLVLVFFAAKTAKNKL